MTTVDIFDVGHGQCALVTCDGEQRVLVDCGSSTERGGWTPTKHLRAIGVTNISLLVITNFDEDHARGLPELLSSGITIARLQSNDTVSADVIRQLKSEDGMGAGIDALVRMKSRYTKTDGPPFVLPNIQQSYFRNRYPDFDDENNLSLVTFLRVSNSAGNRIGFLFPGDLETKGWSTLLASDARLRAIAPQINVLIASHHGRESGKSEVLFSDHGCNPYWVVISDKGYEHETQETVSWYHGRARGAQFDSKQRFVLTTRSDGHIRFVVHDTGWYAQPMPDVRPAKPWWHSLL